MARPRARPDYPKSGFAVWLDGELARRKRSRSMMAAAIGSARQTVNAWFTEGRMPTTELCGRVAKYLGVPEEEVLIRAGHLAEDHVYQQPDIPGWLTAALDGLEDWELQVVAATARGLREARQDPSLDGLRPR